MRNWLVQGTKRQKQVTYTEVIHNHYKFRHAVDDHNAKRHSPISLEVVWVTKWPNRVFAFILSVTEVNAMLAYKHFCKEEVDGMLGFRTVLAEVLVSNPFYKEEDESPRGSSRLTKTAEHRVFRLPKQRQDIFRDRGCGCWNFPPPKYMQDSDMFVYAPWVSIIVLIFVYIIPWEQHWVPPVQTDTCLLNFPCCDWHMAKYY